MWLLVKVLSSAPLTRTTLPSVKVLSSRRVSVSVSKPRTLVLLRPELESHGSSGCEQQQPVLASVYAAEQ